MVLVKLKWNKVTFDNVELDAAKPVSAFKGKIYEITNVPVERQKLMAKGAWVGVLKDEVDLASCNLKDGLNIMLMGAADVVEKPKEKVIFVEDMTPEEIAIKGASAPAGLTNLGNTCYLNSTVQCLRYIPELREALKGVEQPALISNMRSMFDDLDRSGVSVAPYRFVSTLRSAYPQYAELSSHGNFLQQDAEEFFNTLMTDLRMGLMTANSSLSEFLEFEVEETLTCQESSTEASITNKETSYKLVCNIRGGLSDSSNIDHLRDGLLLGMEGNVEKHSLALGRNATWIKKQRISTLSPYLCVQFLRFFWKANPDSRDSTGTKCKILRSVTFPETLDVFEFCSDKLQKKLIDNRNFSSKLESAMSDANAGNSAEASMEVEENESLKMAMELSLAPDLPSHQVGKGVPAGFRGIYELHGIVTHKGRSADSGHYIGWVRQSPGSSYWWCFNDDKVTEVRTEDILLLRGGGDREMAYLNFYRFKE